MLDHINKKYKKLKEAFNRIDEMPDWNDANKDMGFDLMMVSPQDYIADMADWGEPEEHNFGEFSVYIWFDHGAYKAAVMSDDGIIAEGIWYHENIYPVSGYRTESMVVNGDFRGQGIASSLYMLMIENYFEVLYSDGSLTGEEGEKGSFHLWASLSKQYYSYIYDDDEQSYTPVEQFERKHMNVGNTLFVLSVEDIG